MKLTLILVATMAAIVGFATEVMASTCDISGGKTIDGVFKEETLLMGGPDGTVFDFKQNGCELNATVTKFYGPIGSGWHYSQGSWSLDLTGQTDSKIPQEFILDNSGDSTSAKMTQSLTVRTTLQADGSILIRALFDVEKSGIAASISAETLARFYVSNVPTSGGIYQATLAPISPFKFRVVSASNPAIVFGANWLLEALEGDVIYRLFPLSKFRFYRL